MQEGILQNAPSQELEVANKRDRKVYFAISSTDGAWFHTQTYLAPECIGRVCMNGLATEYVLFNSNE